MGKRKDSENGYCGAMTQFLQEQEHMEETRISREKDLVVPFPFFSLLFYLSIYLCLVPSLPPPFVIFSLSFSLSLSLSLCLSLSLSGGACRERTLRMVGYTRAPSSGAYHCPERRKCEVEGCSSR